jgi:hypothetical protein
MNSGTTLRRFPVRPALISRALISRAFISRGLIRAALPALAATLLLAGCGGGGSSDAAATPTVSAASSATSSAGLSAFETCLKQHGVKVTPGQFGGRPRASFSPGAFPTAFPSGTPRPHSSFDGRNSAAFKACAKYAPAGGGFGGGFNRAISSSALAAFKSCLSQNGVKVTGNTAGAVLGQLRNSTGKTAAAFRTCRVLLAPTAPTPSPSS